MATVVVVEAAVKAWWYPMNVWMRFPAKTRQQTDSNNNVAKKLGQIRQLQRQQCLRKEYGMRSEDCGSR